MSKTIQYILNYMVVVLLFVLAVLLYFIEDVPYQKIYIVIILVLAVISMVYKNTGRKSSLFSMTGVKHNSSEVVLLGEEDTEIASWSIYGKTGLVIGRDIGENQVDINLEHSVYASMIDIEHAVLNYSGDHWYIEDISQKNGVSICKADGKKYKLSYGKPCKLEKGDIIYIALARLQLI